VILALLSPDILCRSCSNYSRPLNSWRGVGIPCQRQGKKVRTRTQPMGHDIKKTPPPISMIAGKVAGRFQTGTSKETTPPCPLPLLTKYKEIHELHPRVLLPLVILSRYSITPLPPYMRGGGGRAVGKPAPPLWWERGA
jgi:hypothetical protein